MVMILGGVKSGKSSHASAMAAAREGLGRVVYLATAHAGDDEMKDRIRRHREERPAEWITIEEPRNPAACFPGSITKAGAATVLFDCLTLWLTNLLAPFGDEPDRESAMKLVGMECRGLLDAVEKWEAGAPEGERQTLIVSNLVETGLISPWPLGRIFQDLAGLTHQMFASRAGGVYLMTAGLAQKLK